MSKRQWLFWLSIVVLIAVDQLVKLDVRHTLHESQALPYPWPGVFEFQLTYNRGIAFGFLQGKGVLLVPVAVLISFGSIWYVMKHPQETLWNHVAFGLLAAGALGNLIDRVAFGRVTDMFWFRPINFPVFNVADSCITVATFMLIIGWWLEASRRKPLEDETLHAEAK